MTRSATFGLIHGGSHGAWCWAKLIPELERLGRRAITMDLPIDEDDSGPERCAEIVAAALDGIDAPILVAHSLAGTFVPLAAALTAAPLIVFLCAMVPIEGRSLADQLAEDSDIVRYPFRSVSDQRCRTLATREVAQAMYYSDCSQEDIEWAIPLLRWQASALRMTTFPVGGWPDGVATAYILAADDPVVSPDWSRRVARERLRVEPIELPGGHSPFLSQAPALARVLDELAAGVAA